MGSLELLAEISASFKISLKIQFEFTEIEIKMRKIRTDIVTNSNLGNLKSLNEKIFPILSVTVMNDKFYQKFTSEAGFAILAYLDDKLAGAVCCQVLLNNCVYIKFIGTLSRYRRKGVGAALMTKVLHEAETREVNRLYAYVREDNKAAMFLNRKFGLIKNGNCK